MGIRWPNFLPYGFQLFVMRRLTDEGEQRRLHIMSSRPQRKVKPSVVDLIKPLGFSQMPHETGLDQYVLEVDENFPLSTLTKKFPGISYDEDIDPMDVVILIDSRSESFDAVIDRAVEAASQQEDENEYEAEDTQPAEEHGARRGQGLPQADGSGASTDEGLEAEQSGELPAGSERGSAGGADGSGAESPSSTHAGDERGDFVESPASRPRHDEPHATEGMDSLDPRRADAGDDSASHSERDPADDERDEPDVRPRKDSRLNPDLFAIDGLVDEMIEATSQPTVALEDNIAAIETAFRVNTRRAMQSDLDSGGAGTLEDKEVEALARFSGWGNLGAAFNLAVDMAKEREEKSLSLDDVAKAHEEDPEHGSLAAPAKSLVEFADHGRLEIEDLQALSDRAREVDGHYIARPKAVPAHVVRSIWNGIERLGFRSGRVLNPVGDNGVFLGAMPSNIRNGTTAHVAEGNPLSAAVIEALYPGASVTREGFHDFISSRNQYDVVVGQVPFDNRHVYDTDYDHYRLNVPEHYFLKAVDQVREGGVVAMLVPSEIMDSASNALRREVAEKADLLTGMRIQSSATGVYSDLLILQRADNRMAYRAAADPELPLWARPALDRNPIPKHMLDDPEEYAEDISNWEHLHTSRLFHENPDLVLRDSSITGAEDLASRIDSFLADHLPQDVYRERPAKAQDPLDEEEPEVRLFDERVTPVRVGGLILDSNDNPVMIESVGEDGAVEAVPVGELKSHTGKSRLIPKSGMTRLVELIRIRDLVVETLNEQIIEPNEETEAYLDARRRLNEAYDAFVAKHGAIGHSRNAKLFRFDPQSNLLFAIENYDPEDDVAEKTEIFRQRVVSVPRLKRTVDTPEEALEECLALHARVIPAAVAGYLNLPVSEFERLAQKDLRGKVFLNPESNEWQPADVYLSGNIRQKLEIADREAKSDPRLRVNVEALIDALPDDVPIEDISVQLSAPWLELQTINEYVAKVLGVEPEDRSFSVGHTTSTNTWEVNQAIKPNQRSGEHENFSTERRDFVQLIEAGLNRRDIRVHKKRKNKQEKLKLDSKATMAAIQKLEQIQRDFRNWLWNDSKRAEYYHRKYNDQYNSFVRPNPDGSSLLFPGMNPTVELRYHQKSAVRFAMLNRRALFAHEVGTGKTFSMIASLMELSRVGAVKKPWLVAKKSTLSQISAAARQLYPSATILTLNPDDLSADRRDRVLSQIRDRDYDLLIMSQETFTNIGVKPGTELVQLIQSLRWLELARDSSKRANDWLGTKEIMRRIRVSEERYEKLLEREKKNAKAKGLDEDGVNPITIEDLKPGAVAYDESQSLKNGDVESRMRELSHSGAQRTSAALTMFRVLEEDNPNFRLIFSSGTPVTNSFAEVFMLFRFLAKETLKDMTGVPNEMSIDPFAGQFISTETRVELGVDGTYQPRERLKIESVPELMAAMHFMDVRFADELGIPRPKLNAKTITAEPTLAQKIMRFEIADRAEAVRAGRVHPKDDNFLKLGTDGRKVATDPRLVNPNLPDDPNSKINLVVREVAKRHHRYAEARGTQAVFLDQGVPADRPKDQKTINLYEDIRRKLQAYGVPPEEVAFIHEAKTDAKRQKLFDAINAGRIRVIIGSTEKMGVGTNMQERMVAGHHVDPPAAMRPADMEQRIGRFYRQGNRFGTVENLVYTTEGSFDLYVFQLMEAKRRVIHAVLKGDKSVRQIEEDGGLDNFEEIMAATTNDPAIADKIAADAEVAKLESRRDDFERSITRMRREIRSRNYENAHNSRLLLKHKGALGTFEQGYSKTEAAGQEALDRPWTAWVDKKNGSLVHDPDKHPNEVEVKRLSSDELRDAMGVNREAMKKMAANKGRFNRFDIRDSFGLKFYGQSVHLAMAWDEPLIMEQKEGAKPGVRVHFRSSIEMDDAYIADYQRLIDQHAAEGLTWTRQIDWMDGERPSVHIESSRLKGFENKIFGLADAAASIQFKVEETSKEIESIEKKMERDFPDEEALKQARLRQQKAATQAEKAIERLQKEREGIPYSTVQEYAEALKMGRETPEEWTIDGAREDIEELIYPDEEHLFSKAASESLSM